MAANLGPTPRTLQAILLKTLSAFPSPSPSISILHPIPSSPPPILNSTTLYILSSSFNPPTTAHLNLCLSALRIHPSSLPPPQLLLLLSTSNADKPALSIHEIARRATFMALLAQSIPFPTVTAMTPHPYFTDQSAALAEEFVGKAWKQVWLMGADTLIRLFAPRYYPGWDPPLQALRAFMGRAKIRVESRAGVPDGGVEKLEAWRERLGRGQMDTEGGDREWVKRIDIVGKKMESGRGVSSSAVREMVREGLWDKAEAMMPLEVGKWVKDEGFYRS